MRVASSRCHDARVSRLITTVFIARAHPVRRALAVHATAQVLPMVDARQQNVCPAQASRATHVHTPSRNGRVQH